MDFNARGHKTRREPWEYFGAEPQALDTIEFMQQARASRPLPSRTCGPARSGSSSCCACPPGHMILAIDQVVLWPELERGALRGEVAFDPELPARAPERSYPVRSTSGLALRLARRLQRYVIFPGSAAIAALGLLFAIEPLAISEWK